MKSHDAIRPEAASIRLAMRWCERAVAEVERTLVNRGAQVDRSALRSRLGKIQSGRRLLAALLRAEISHEPSHEPLRIAGNDVKRSGRSQVDCVVDHVTSSSLAQIASALNANVFRANRVRSRQLRMTRVGEPIEFAWTSDGGGAAALIAIGTPSLPAADATAIARGGGERFSLVQFFNAGSFQAAFTAGVSDQARSLGLSMNQRDPADADIRAMKQRIDAAIADPRTAGLIIHSGQAIELHPLVERARRAGKAVVTSNLLAPPLNTPSIVLDDIGTGTMLAQALLADLTDEPPQQSTSGRFTDTHVGAQVLLVGGAERELPHMRLRQQGFLDALAEQSRMTFREVYGAGVALLPKLVERLRRKPRNVAAIVAFYDDVTRYAAQAIELSKSARQTLLYGVDLGDPELEEMESHAFWRASVAFDAFALGAAATRLLAAALRTSRWISLQRFPIVIDGMLLRREQVLKLRDRTASGLARSFPSLTQSCDRIVPIDR
jgi:ABC-type sugar transport system substrate-binding protein